MEEIESRKKTAESENKKMFRSRFDIFVLNALDDKDGASYGYDVINYIQNKTKGHYKIKTYSTIYNTLKRLEEQNFVVSGAGDGETNGAARVYYTLTPEGKKYLEDNKEEYKYLRTLLDNLLTDEDFDLENEEAPYYAGDLKPLTKRNRHESQGSIDNSDEEVAAVGYVAENDKQSDNELSQTETVMKTDSAQTSVISSSVADSLVADSVSGVNKNDLGGFTPSRSKKSNTDYKAVFEKITAPVINGEGGKQTKNNKPAVTAKEKFSVQPSPKTNPKNSVKIALKEQSVETKSIKSDAKTIEESNIDKFRNSLRSEGFALNSYRAGKESVGNVKYVYVNRLLRDVVALSALYMIITLLLLYFLRSIFGFSLTALIVCGSLALASALVVALVWFRNPDKRRKDKVNLKAINAGAIGFFTLFFMLDLIVALLVPGGKGLNSAEIYSPVIIASTSVFMGLIFTVLYKSDNYFQK